MGLGKREREKTLPLLVYVIDSPGLTVCLHGPASQASECIRVYMYT